MFKHILIPTDGSELAGKAIDGGVRLAKALGAKITAYHAIEGLEVQGACESGANDSSWACGRRRRPRASYASRS